MSTRIFWVIQDEEEEEEKADDVKIRIKEKEDKKNKKDKVEKTGVEGKQRVDERKGRRQDG